MKIVKILNNNVVYARASDGSYVIVMGKGIGFHGKAGAPVDETRVDKVIRMDSQKTTDQLVSQLEELPQEHFELSTEIIDYAAKKLDTKLNKNVYLTLTDHISFSIQRYHQGLSLPNPLFWEIKKCYPAEFEIGKYAVSLIESRLNIPLGEDEGAFIALHIVCARSDADMHGVMDTAKMVAQLIGLVEDYFQVKLDADSYRFQRFVTHLRFLCSRIGTQEQWTAVDNMDEDFVSMVKTSYQQDFACSQRLGEYIAANYQRPLSDLELVYLAIHLRNLRVGGLKEEKE